MRNPVLSALVLACSLATGPAFAEVNLCLAHATPETDLVHAYAQSLADEVAARTDGDVTVTIYPNGQLGGDQQMLDGVRAGVIDMVVMGSSGIVGIAPEVTAFDLPFMFANRTEAYAALDGKAGEAIFDKLEGFGLKGLSMPENGFRPVSNNRGPVETPSDLEGLRMRVNNSVVMQDMFDALNANPQPLDYAELYTALETGVVSAQDQPLNLLLGGKFYEHQPYVSLTRHSYSPLVSIMNLPKFQSLTPEQQAAVQDAAAAAADAQRTLHAEKEEEMIAELEGHGLTVTRKVDTPAFQEAVQPVWDKFRSAYGEDMLTLIEADKAAR